jgi:hypothetical protein
MPLYELQLECFDGYETPTDDDKCEFNEKYYFYIDGYSLTSDIAFITFEMGVGSDENSAVFDAYKKVQDRLSIRYHIQASEMKITDSRKLTETEQRTGFIFYPSDNDLIEEFKEDEERHLMFLEDNPLIKCQIY